MFILTGAIYVNHSHSPKSVSSPTSLHLQPFVLIYLTLGFLLHSTVAFNRFCSVLCSNQSCNTNAFGDCTACSQPWQYNALTNQCQVTNLQWKLISVSADIGGNLTSNSSTIGNCNKTSPTGWSYSYIGNFVNKYSIKFNHIKGPQLPHYQIRIIFWMIFIDEIINTNDLIIVTYNSMPQFMKVIQYQASQNVCQNTTQSEYYLKFDRIFQSNTTGPCQIIVTGKNMSKWGIKQLILLAKYCHSSCSSCFGSLSTQCYGCILTMFLSNATCDSQCLPTFGVNSSSNVCIQCDSKCLSCYDSPVNCSQCVSSGQNASFFIQSNNTCVSSCPAELYSNATDRKCYACTASLGYLLVNGTTCIYCPVANCTLCSESGSTYTCESCQSGFTLFKGGNACVECSVVDCTLCQQVNICKTCKDGYTLVNNTCVECNVQNCLYCNQINICLVCVDNLKKYKSLCWLCSVQNCQVCSGNNSCQICVDGFQLNVLNMDKICVKSPENKTEIWNSSDKMKATIGIIVSCSTILALVVIFGICYCYQKRKQDKRKYKVSNQYEKQNKIENDNYNLTQQQTRNDLMPNLTSSRKFSGLKTLNAENSMFEIEELENSNIGKSYKSKQSHVNQMGVVGRIRQKELSNQNQIKQLQKQEDEQNQQYKQRKQRRMAKMNKIKKQRSLDKSKTIVVCEVDSNRIDNKKKENSKDHTHKNTNSSSNMDIKQSTTSVEQQAITRQKQGEYPLKQEANAQTNILLQDVLIQREGDEDRLQQVSQIQKTGDAQQKQADEIGQPQKTIQNIFEGNLNANTNDGIYMYQKTEQGDEMADKNDDSPEIQNEKVHDDSSAKQARRHKKVSKYFVQSYISKSKDKNKDRSGVIEINNRKQINSQSNIQLLKIEPARLGAEQLDQHYQQTYIRQNKLKQLQLQEISQIQNKEDTMQKDLSSFHFNQVGNRQGDQQQERERGKSQECANMNKQQCRHQNQLEQLKQQAQQQLFS